MYHRFLLLILIAVLSSSAQAMQQCTSLKAAGAEQWRPFAYTEKSPKPVAKGIAHDFVLLIGKELNLPVQQRLELPWKRIEMQLESGELDVLAGNYWSEERAAKWLLTDSFASEQVHLLTLKSKRFEFESLADLRGKSGVVPRGVSLGKDFDKARANLKVLEVRTHEQMYDMLQKERVDYMVSPYFAATRHLQDEKNQHIVILPNPINSYDIHLSLSPSSPCALLLPKINQVIQDKKLDGTLDQIIQRYTQ